MFKDIQGKKFFRLTAKKWVSKGKWEFLCDCGNHVFARTRNVKSGATKSCGCWRKDFMKKGLNRKTHGLSKTRFYKVWKQMKKRCTNPKDKSWNRYGGRGIKCEWNSFKEFKDDMYVSYLVHKRTFGKAETQIDRIDNDGNYFKENCRWTTAKEQARNRRNNFIYEFRGEHRTIAEWSEILGFSYNRTYKRAKKGLTLI